MAGRGPCLDCWHCPKKGGAGAVVAVVIGVLALARAGAVVRVVEVAAEVVVVTVASVAALIVAVVVARVAVRVRRRRQRQLLADTRAITAASLAIEAPRVVIPGELIGVSATDPLPRVRRTASRQGTRAASQ